MTYRAPLQEILFVINDLAELPALHRLPGFEEAAPETVEAILEENARFCEEVVAPLDRAGDVDPARWQDGSVCTTPGFRQAYADYAKAGWQSLRHAPEHGGQGLPALVAAACNEMLNSANMSFGLCPLLTDGCIEALMTAGSARQKQQYLDKLVSGVWTGTMNLTEPQAGSDLSLVRTRAVPQADGAYRLFGTKIYITYGEHDLAENILHLVLARTPDAPAGVKGISLFLVPKFLVLPDGSLGERNDVQCVSIEHKLGIKASPTAVLQFGDSGGALGELVGEENRGLEYMFVMMNAARFAVGMQGVAIAERATQKAAAYARDRVQSRSVTGSAGPVAIVNHPDVRRMLMTMRAQTQAARALAYVAAAAADMAQKHPDEAVRRTQQSRYELLVPIVKGWSTEMAVEVASMGIQVHGGMGFIEETGAAQLYRDARILPIYEGTTAIQANDLVGRKTVRDGGVAMQSLLSDMTALSSAMQSSPSASLQAISRRLEPGIQNLQDAVRFMLDHAASRPQDAYAGSVPYLKLAGIVLGAWQLARAADVAHANLAAGKGDAGFWQAKILTARFFAEHVLPQAGALRAAIVDGADSVMALDAEAF